MIKRIQKGTWVCYGNNVNDDISTIICDILNINYNITLTIKKKSF